MKLSIFIDQNIYLKKLVHRGLIFYGSGPVVLSVVCLFIEMFSKKFSLNDREVCLAIFSTNIIAFVHAGSAIFVVLYFAIWLCVYFSVKATSKKRTEKSNSYIRLPNFRQFFCATFSQYLSC